MIIELRLPDDSKFTMMVANSSSQELEIHLRKLTGLDSISLYTHWDKEVAGWKNGKQYQACYSFGRWKLYPVPDAK